MECITICALLSILISVGTTNVLTKRYMNDLFETVDIMTKSCVEMTKKAIQDFADK